MKNNPENQTLMPDKTGKKAKDPNRRVDGRFTANNHANDAGRPKGSKNFTTMVREALEKIALSEGKKKTTYYELLIKRVLNKAITEGDREMIKQIWDQLDGRPSQKVDVTSGGDRIEGFTYVVPDGDGE